MEQLLNKHLILTLLFSYFLVFLVILFDRKFSVGMWRELLTSSLLSLVQLIAVAFVILYLLKLNVEALNFAVVLLFYFNASLIAARRFTLKAYPKRRVFLIVFATISLITTAVLTLLYLAGLLTLKPNSLIPLAGIVTAAGMRSLSLAFKYFKSKVEALSDVLLGMFALGASDVEVFKFLFRSLIDDITVPVRDMFRSAGIVHIPGVMVGLLVAGIFPLKAALFQFAILSTMVFQFTFVPAVALFSLIYTSGLKLEA
ncbi:ABC transporter permease [Thermovibrio ammonificans]|uniref:ABC transport system permease protein n=1 Tax=Thermovibrio ammonificans (strain DSM 15698 / JCM 12110 / HB-1) TaxID=648996 RepID=E8T1Z5_THEA1|nr:ABC transporter permease [Thermovibrio ammonificans]ADU96890.1 Conserved hypothetical protein CHP00245 [Thermovibrio ammonificans HB-1]